MGKGRLEAFSDGVLAVIITVMVLELKIPHGAELSAIQPLLPVFFSYILSFIFIGIYWSNHHHLLHAVQKINGSILWANLHLLFWLSLIPFLTGWMGENSFAPLPVALYGIVLLFSGLAYYILSQILVHFHGKESTLAKAIGSDTKGLLSLGFYAAAIPLAFIHTSISYGLYICVALIWLVPDRRIEKTIQ